MNIIYNVNFKNTSKITSSLENTAMVLRVKYELLKFRENKNKYKII